MLEFIAYTRLVWRYRHYRPQPVSFNALRRWLAQFQKQDRRLLTNLASKIVFFSESQTKKALVDQNDALLARLRASGLRLPNIIYVSLHDAGSSSPAMLNMLRDAARLERLGCRLMDSQNALGINKLTNKLGEGAIVYVDDFLGTGDQFCSARDFMMASVVGSYSEFLLVPCICEEAYSRLAKIGVEVFTRVIHLRAERPLHDNCRILDQQVKTRLRSLCAQIDARSSLGYAGLASMIVFYRNAPNSLPAIFRGNVDQKPYVGLLPRISDLPKRVVA
jgi:hypothetical protein